MLTQFLDRLTNIVRLQKQKSAPKPALVVRAFPGENEDEIPLLVGETVTILDSVWCAGA
jgi:hypothetical protein